MEASLKDKLKPLSINEILDKQFLIRGYQRGYRWTKQQVEQLLNDIDDFTSREIKGNPEQKTFYCLQPVVLKRINTDFIGERKLDGEWYEVVDGQQRLTTIFLILKYINEFWTGRQKKPAFTIDYETRENCLNFLQNIKVNEDATTVEINKEYIDFYYISKAYETIRNWEINYESIHGKPLDDAGFQSKFLSYSKIIWYEAGQDEDSIELFERLNLGKIPLTNAELTKALFLSADSFKELGREEQSIKHFEIALLWDEIEHKLNEPDKKFWSFITNKTRESFETKIELILDLIAEKPDGHTDPLYTFLDFSRKSNSYLMNGKPQALSEVWSDIEQFYQTLVEWNLDRDLYHQIGYLVSCRNVSKFKKVPLYELVKYSINNDKKSFQEYIQSLITSSIKFELSELRYDEHPDKIYNVLLLFNVETYRTSKSIDDYYPFKQHKSNQWSLEHIHAQNSEGLDKNKKEQWVQWLNLHTTLLKELAVAPEFKGSASDIDALIKDIEENINEQLTWERFTPLFEAVTEVLTYDSDRNDTQPDGLGNMALLSQADNAALNNSSFGVKRREILRLDKAGNFIPICTRRVFQNYYPENDMTSPPFFWTPDNRDAYFEEIKETLRDYMAGNTEEGLHD